MAIITDKQTVRAGMREKTSSINSDTQALLSLLIFENLIRLEELNSAKDVFCFVGVRGEPDTTAIISYLLEQGKNVCVPKCYRGGIMEARRIKNLDELVPVPPFGIPEPGPDTEIVPPHKIDIALIPGLAFDTTGGRLGKGAGYYDRFLKDTTAYRCAICFEFALIDTVPTTDHDISMDMVVTESKIIRV